MAARSTNVVLENQAGRINLRKESDHLDHGVYVVTPPMIIGNLGEWRSESNGFATGTEGHATYIIEDVDQRRLGQLKLHWNNPFIGANSYHESVSPQATVDLDGFSIGHFGGGGNDATVRFVLESGLCQFDSETGETICTGTGGLTTTDARYAAIWEQRSGTSWFAKHGLTSAQYQQAFDDFVRRGYRLIDVSGYNVNGTDRYTGIWEQRQGPAWQARHGLSSAQYQQVFGELASQGYRLTDLSGYDVGGSDHYAAIWEQISGPAWQARHGLTAEQYQQTFNELVGQGYRLIHVCGYGIGGRDHYAAVWEKRSGPAWQARHGLNTNQYQQAFGELASQGFRLTEVSGYVVNGEDRYAAIWEHNSGPAWQARHGLSSQQYQHEFGELLSQGFRVVQVSGYGS